MQTKHIEKTLGGNYSRMLHTILMKIWKQHITKQELYGHLSLISQTIRVNQLKHAGHWWRNKDQLLSDILFWNSAHERANIVRPG